MLPGRTKGEKVLKEQEKRGKATHRVNVYFSDEAYEALNEIAHRKGKSISDVLRDALALEKWYEDTKQEGARVLVEREDGQLREIVRP